MRALSLDYQQHRRPSGWLDILLLAAGISLTVVLAIHSVNVFSEINTLEARHAAFEHKSNRGATDLLSTTDTRQLQREVKQASEVLAQLALPWEGLFTDIESSQMHNVALLSIEPDPRKRVIKITGEAKHFDAMLDYLRSLQKKESLTDIHLQTHHIQKQTAGRPVRFVVAASWVIKP